MTDNEVNGVAGICAGDTIFFGCLVMKRQVKINKGCMGTRN